MSDEDRHSKTEDATETKIREAIEKGNVPFSREPALFATTLAMLAAATLILPRAGAAAAQTLGALLDRSATMRIGVGADVGALSLGLAALVLAVVGPVALLIAVASVAACVAQTPPRVVLTRIAPDVSRLSPAKGLSRLVGARGLVEFLKGLAKLAICGGAVAWALRADMPRLTEATLGDPRATPELALGVTARLIAIVALFAGLIAAADLVWSRRRWRADLRMSRHEVKEEHKRAEGDPLLKARRRSIALDRARRRMIASVPRATVVIANPTHFAVALRYVRGEGAAPLVVAKGQDLVALRIRERAAQCGVPIVENKPLARALYDQVEVDRMIPAEFYRAVAEILTTLLRRGAAA